MIKLVMTFLILIFAAPVHANCTTYGSGSFKTTTCSDGNTYTTQKFGNTSITNGQNNRTGTSWNQTNRSFGSGMSTQSGTDSRGNNYSCTTINGITTC